MNLKIHPVCDLFPMMPDRHPAFIQLMANIAIHGLIDPIVLDSEGRILDGRHRLIACEKENVEARFVNFTDLNFGGSEGDFAFARNLWRRDLTDDQRAALMVQYQNYLNDDENWRSKKAKEQPKSPHGTFVPVGKEPETTREKLQKHAKVSARKAREVLAVAKHAPELLEAVKEGTVKLKEANKTAQARKPSIKPRKPRPFDFENLVDQIDNLLKKKFARCPALLRIKLKQRVIAIVEDQ